MHVVLHRGGLLEFMDEVGLMAAYLAAVIHDVGHLGVSNNFLIQTEHDLAILYNDAGPMENMHAATAFQLLKHRPEINFLENLTPGSFRELRRLVMGMVLATDMSRHFQVVTQFQTAERIGGA